MYTDLESAIDAFNVALDEVTEDMGGDADEYACDVAIGIAYECTPEIARELCRVELGFIPDALSILPNN